MMIRTLRAACVLGLLIGTAGLLTGCENKGPAEQAGENIDKGVQNVKDAVTPAGPVEKAGRAVDRTVNP